MFVAGDLVEKIGMTVESDDDEVPIGTVGRIVKTSSMIVLVAWPQKKWWELAADLRLVEDPPVTTPFITVTI